MTAGVPVTDVDCDVSIPGPEPLQASVPAEKRTPTVSYETVEGEPRTTTSDSEDQETSKEGRTITRRVKTIRYYQPVVHRTLEDGVVVKETSEDVLVGSYVDEYCFDAPLDVVDVYSASVETQTSVDENEQTLDDGTWLRRKVTRVVAYLAVNEEEADSIRDAAGAKPKPSAETDHEMPPDSRRADQPHHETKTDRELERSATDDGPEPKSAVERVSEQAIVESVEKPVDNIVQPDAEHVQHAQLESGSVSLPTTTQSTDGSDLTCKVERSSIVVETEAEYKVEHAVVSHDEQIAICAAAPGESSITTGPKDRSVQSTVTSDIDIQRRATDGPLELKVTAEPVSEQVIEESVEKPVDTVMQPDIEQVQHAQLESGSISLPTTKQSTDGSDLICKVENSSIIVETEAKCKVEHAVVSHDEQIATCAAAPGESSVTTGPDNGSVQSTETYDLRFQERATDGPLELKFSPEPVNEQAIVQSVDKPVDTVMQPDTEHVQHAQLESGSISLPTTTQSTDGSDLTCKVKRFSVVVETEAEYKVEHAVISHDEQIATCAAAPSESFMTAEPEERFVQFTETSDIDFQKSVTDVPLELKVLAEPVSEQAIVQSVEKPVDTVIEPDTEHVQHAQPESGSFSLPTIKQSTDNPDLTCKIEPSSTIVEREAEYKVEHAVVSHDEQIATCTAAPGESSFTTAPEGMSVQSIERSDVDFQRSAPDGQLELKVTAEPVSEQAIVESVEKPVDTVMQPDIEHVQHAQLESGSISLPTTKQSTDSSDLTCKIERSSIIVETEAEYKVEHAAVSHDEQIATCAPTPSEGSMIIEPGDRFGQFTGISEEPMPVTEELIVAVPNPQQERARPTMATEPVTSYSDELKEFPVDEELIEEQQTSEQFAVAGCDHQPVTEEIIMPSLRSSALETVKPATISKVDDAVYEEAPRFTADADKRQPAAVTEELITAVPDPQQERARPLLASVPVTSSFDEPEKLTPDEHLIKKEHTAQQYAAPVCDDVMPVEGGLIAPEVSSQKDITKPVEQTLEQAVTAKTPEALSKTVTVECADDRTAVAVQSTLPMDHSETVQPETAPVTEELIVAVADTRQDRSRPVTTNILATSSCDEPEELIEECHTVEQIAAPVCDLRPVEEGIIAPDIRPPRDTATLESRIEVSNAVDRTPFIPVDKNKTPEAVQSQPDVRESRAATAVNQQRTRPVLILRSESDTKPTPVASTYMPMLPPTRSSRQPRRPHSASEMTRRRQGIESPQPGMYSKSRMRRESPLSFVDRLVYPASPTSPLGVEDFDIELFDDGRRQVRTRSKKLITRKVRKVRHDGEVVEDIVTEEVPADYGYSETSSLRSGQSPAAIMSPRTPSFSSLTSPLPLEPASPGADSLSSQSSLRVFTDTVEGEPEVVTDVQEREETLPDGRVVIRKVIRTRQKQTIVKRTVMEGPSTDEDQPTEGGEELVVAGEGVQKPDIRTYADAMEMRPTTETVSNDVEEVLPDGTVLRKLTTTTSTRQLKTDRTVVEGPYLPETVNQALQGDILRPGELAMLSQSASSSSALRPSSRTGGTSRQSPRPKFRISMESPTPPTQTAAEPDSEAARTTTTDASRPDDQLHRPT